MQQLFASSFSVLFAIIPIGAPIVLWFIFWDLWVDYVRKKFFASQKHILLEIKIPREIEKTPVAMELVFTALNQTGGESTWIDRYWKGKTRPWFSFEMVSIDGQVRFYVWTRASWKKHIERSIYSQYSTTEVTEVNDYTFGASHLDLDVWGCELKLTAADPYPIKTYVDYGLDKADTDEAMKNDPLTTILEYLGSLEKGEQAWIQIIARGRKEKPDSWKETAKSEIKKIMDSKKLENGGSLPLTKDEQDIISALTRSTSKPGFDVGIRLLYIAKKGLHNPINITGITSAFKQFSSSNLNGFAPTGGMTVIDYPWQDIGGIRSKKIKKNLIAAYKQRSYFYPPFKEKSFVLNTEEMATLFHFPGSVASTPTFRRVQSRKSEAPSNLPI